jgi:uncharacterized protein YndB with AHSA1/START domain
VEKRPSGRAKLTLPSDTEIEIVRDFNARRANVFDAWSKPEWVQRWYGCADQTMTRCEIDFREGGKWRWGLRGSDGVEHVFSGSYRVIDRPQKLSFTERYEVIPGSDYLVDLDFRERAGTTTMTMRFIHETKLGRDAHLGAGIEQGIQAQFDRFEELVQTGLEATP